MLRSAIAVLAIALSSVPAAAQSLRKGEPLPGVTYTIDMKAQMPVSLTQLYLKQAALQGLDAATTLHALNQGHMEANPLLKSGNPALIVGSKVAAMSVSVMLAQKLWKRNPKAAVITMVVTNAALSAVIANNSAVLRNRR